jgi:hypothetical protein
MFVALTVQFELTEDATTFQEQQWKEKISKLLNIQPSQITITNKQ